MVETRGKSLELAWRHVVVTTTAHAELSEITHKKEIYSEEGEDPLRE